MKEQQAGLHIFSGMVRRTPSVRPLFLLVLTLASSGAVVVPSGPAWGSTDEPLYIVAYIHDEDPGAIHEAAGSEDDFWCPEHHLSSSCSGCPLCYMAVSSAFASPSGANALWVPVRALGLREAIPGDRFRPPTVSHP